MAQTAGRRRMTRAPVSGPRIVLSVLIPFGLGYYLSYLYRTVNAVISPALAAEIGLGPAQLGFVTSVYFIAFAAFQIPLGLLLDRYGPRRIQACLLAVAALGAGLFAHAESLLVLGIARGLIGLGVSACLMAALKANAEWWPPERLPLVNNVIAAFGSFGALSATTPAQLVLEAAGWRALFWGLAALTAGLAVLTWAAVPAQGGAAHRPTGRGDGLAALPGIVSSGYFRRVATVLAVCHGAFMVYQTLWAAPWLRDVAGLDPQGAAEVLLLIQLGMFVGILANGLLADRLQRVGVPTERLVAAGLGLCTALQALLAAGVTWAVGPLWFAVGVTTAAAYLCFALLAQRFPPQAIGRVATSANLVLFVLAFVFQWGIGAVIGLFPPVPGGGYAPAAHAAAFGILVALQAAALLWFVWPRRGGA